MVGAEPNRPPKSRETTKALYWCGLVISADQILTQSVRTMDQKIHAHLPNRLDRGDHSMGPNASPAMAAEICGSQHMAKGCSLSKATYAIRHLNRGLVVERRLGEEACGVGESLQHSCESC